MLNSPQTTQHYDLVIAGAGMVGSLLALSVLKQCPTLNVLLLDANPERVELTQAKNTNPSFDARSIALNAGSVDLLKVLGLWPDIVANAEAIKQIEVSDEGHFGSVSMTPNLPQPFGYVVELQAMGKVLAHELSLFSALDIQYSTAIIGLEQQLAFATCKLSNGQDITTKLLVGADGTHSKVRQLANIKSNTADYQRSAVICNVRTNVVHDNAAYERFCNSGPIALLPLTDNRYSLVLCVENEHVEMIKQFSEVQFLAYLQHKFGYRAGVFESAGKRDIYPLSLLKTDYPLAHRVLCIGNAAHSLHPVAGQGFNLGFRDLHVLAQVISHTDQEQIGTYTMLNQYWQSRQSDHHNTIAMTDGLVKLFSNDNPLLTTARNAGLRAMSVFPFLSQPIINQAKGQIELFDAERLIKESFL